MNIQVSTLRLVPGAPPPSADLEAFAEVSRRSIVATLGDDDLADPAHVVISAFAEQNYRRKMVLLARDGARTLGGLWLGLPLKDNTSLAEASFSLDPDHDPAPVVDALWAGAVPVLRAEGRRTALVWSDHAADADAEHVVPRTGVGSVPRDALATALLDLGFVLEQVERHSVLAVAPALERAAAELPAARQAAGTAYRTLGWVGPVPPERRGAMARLMSRMSTDVPAGALELEEEVWDADRVAESDRVCAQAGRARVMTVAEHVASGELAAYTYVDLPGDKPAVGYQEDTLVHADHRGHRLGMLVKAENLRRVAEHAPALERLHTWNADENGHMLAINEALGFRPASHEGAWQLAGV
ncbi:GNAT family N-acetyltransferase [Ornithinimicrobium avium]|uniref:GNAT family N-acetyltransferase n=1 Tax=Ornithinimicrobium avium TaxID=2283195 RepID=A0A345NJZ2_9MICO|nr:GNAT family N-acetyltransferase [Ornithinimicrobium avium]AXH95350.1 GNAT family N-acetyltransferase [Ornithinimicrobium avium]